LARPLAFLCETNEHASEERTRFVRHHTADTCHGLWFRLLRARSCRAKENRGGQCQPGKSRVAENHGPLATAVIFLFCNIGPVFHAVQFTALYSLSAGFDARSSAPVVILRHTCFDPGFA